MYGLSGSLIESINFWKSTRFSHDRQSNQSQRLLKSNQRECLRSTYRRVASFINFSSKAQKTLKLNNMANTNLDTRMEYKRNKFSFAFPNSKERGSPNCEHCGKYISSSSVAQWFSKTFLKIIRVIRKQAKRVKQASMVLTGPKKVQILWRYF